MTDVFSRRALLLLTGCVGGCVTGQQTSVPVQWGNPIDEYIAVGDVEFPDGYDRNIKDLVVHRDMLWVGYGDGTRNMGSSTPVEYRYYPSPAAAETQIARVEADGQGAPQRTPGDTGEEQVGHFRLLSVGGEPTLWQAGADSTDADGFRELTAWGNVRVHDCTKGYQLGDVLLLVEQRTEPSTFAVVKSDSSSLTELDVVLELGETAASSITLWQGDLFIGTDLGAMLRAKCF